MKDFRKRTFDLPLFARSLGSAVIHLPVLIAALLVPSTSRALREKVMLAVTSVNDCRYCSYVHSGLALANGVDLGELRQLLDRGTFGEVDEREAVAALFAQHFAETLRHPSPSARAALARQFNAYQRLEIMAYIHAIYLANLCGNTFDAWLERLPGHRVADGHPLGSNTGVNELNPQLRASALVMKLIGWGLIIGGPIAALAYAPGFLWGELPSGFPLYGPQHPPSPLNGAHPYLYMMYSLYVAWAILLIRGAKDPKAAVSLFDWGILANALHGSLMVIQVFIYPNEHAHLWTDIPILFAISAVMWRWHPNRRSVAVPEREVGQPDREGQRQVTVRCANPPSQPNGTH